MRNMPRSCLLSGGKRGMLAIAPALMADPVLILMNEPSERLDPGDGAARRGIIHRLKADGLAILPAEQNLHSALAAFRSTHPAAVGA